MRCVAIIKTASCFNTQPPEAAGSSASEAPTSAAVSTHSRPKAAGFVKLLGQPRVRSFNTQPPEGGWDGGIQGGGKNGGFNTQPPEGGWGRFGVLIGYSLGFNTQPPEGGWVQGFTEIVT